jgi:rhodanese-related sulfurtransferase
MAQAVPANLACGRPADDAFPKPPGWGPVIRTFAGVWEVEPEWVHQHSSELCLIDVREDAEVAASPMGLLAGSKVIPLSVLRQRTDEVPRDCPTVTLCPAGARSAFAATILEKSGVREVANMRGGILQWRALGFPVKSPSENSS